ncbi:hypothetical protein EWM60_08190 [Candidatus Erwinia dacicola]|nr:hypothetical protein [Candidatus Erwinia dacicola]
MTGNTTPGSACSTCAMGVRRYCCASPDCTHSRFFCQSCKFKPTHERRIKGIVRSDIHGWALSCRYRCKTGPPADVNLTDPG